MPRGKPSPLIAMAKDFERVAALLEAEAAALREAAARLRGVKP